MVISGRNYKEDDIYRQYHQKKRATPPNIVLSQHRFMSITALSFIRLDERPYCPASQPSLQQSETCAVALCVPNKVG